MLPSVVCEGLLPRDIYDPVTIVDIMIHNRSQLNHFMSEQAFVRDSVKEIYFLDLSLSLSLSLSRSSPKACFLSFLFSSLHILTSQISIRGGTNRESEKRTCTQIFGKSLVKEELVEWSEQFTSPP